MMTTNDMVKPTITEKVKGTCSKLQRYQAIIEVMRGCSGKLNRYNDRKICGL
jgi:hypothetical protein